MWSDASENWHGSNFVGEKMVSYILMGVMAVLLLCWVLTVAISYFRKIKKIMIQSGMVAHVKCEKCAAEYDVNAQVFTKGGMVKEITVTKTQVKGVALDNSPNYRYYAKKFCCPNCGNKRYAQVLNHAELLQKNRPIALNEGVKYILAMVLGGMVIMTVMRIPITIAQKVEERQAEKQVEELREQMYQQKREQFFENLELELE